MDEQGKTVEILREYQLFQRREERSPICPMLMKK